MITVMMTIRNPNPNLNEYEFGVQQEKMSESGFVKTESQSSETTELPTEEDIQLQYNSTVNKSTGRSKELCKIMLFFCVLYK